jgi:hypothetical protein
MGATSVMGSPNSGTSLAYYENLKESLKKGIEIGNETIGGIAFSDDGNFLMIDQIKNGGFLKRNKTVRILINISNFKKNTELKGVKIEFYGTQEGEDEIEKMREIIREILPKEITKKELAELERKQRQKEQRWQRIENLLIDNSQDYEDMTMPSDDFGIPEEPPKKQEEQKKEPQKKA